MSAPGFTIQQTPQRVTIVVEPSVRDAADLSVDWVERLQTPELCIDLGQVPLVNSLFIKWLFQVIHAQRHAAIVIVGIHPRTQEVFRSLGLVRMFTCDPGTGDLHRAPRP